MANQSFCEFHGPLELESKMPTSIALNQQLVASVTVSCDFDCPGVAPETSMAFALTDRNEEGPSFVRGAMVHAEAQLIVTYQAEGPPSMVVAADLLRPLTGQPPRRRLRRSSGRCP